MKKVIFVANNPWYLSNFRRSTLISFKQRYRTICMYPKGFDSDELHSINTDNITFQMNPHGTNFCKEFLTLFHMMFNFIKVRPDAVFSFNPKTNIYSLLCCFILSIPCAVNVSGVGMASKLQGFTGWVYRKLCKSMYMRAAFIFFQNKDDKEFFIKNSWAREEQCVVLPGSGVDLSLFTPNRTSGTVKSFLMASRLIKPKGVLEYINAAKIVRSRFPETKFFLAGIKDNSCRKVDDSIISDAEKLGAIDFLGHVRDISDVMKQVDCIVLPSYYPEGTPRILIEAAAAGKIIITTDTPGCRDLVYSGRNGFFVKPNSVDDLVRQMHQVLDLTSKDVSAMSKASRSLAEHKYDENYVVRKYLEVADVIV